MPKTDVEVKLTGTDGNVFALMGKVAKALRRAGHPDLADEFTKKVFQSGSYDESLRIMMEYVDVS